MPFCNLKSPVFYDNVSFNSETVNKGQEVGAGICTSPCLGVRSSSGLVSGDGLFMVPDVVFTNNKPT